MLRRFLAGVVGACAWGAESVHVVPYVPSASSATHRDMAQTLAEQAIERQIMKLGRQRIPTPPLARVPHGANRHLARRDPAAASLRCRHASHS